MYDLIVKTIRQAPNIIKLTYISIQQNGIQNTNNENPLLIFENIIINATTENTTIEKYSTKQLTKKSIAIIVQLINNLFSL